LEVTGYYIDGKNMIQEVLIAAPPPVKQNTGSFTNKGVELTSNFYLKQNLTFNLNYTYLNTSREFKYAPEHEINFHGMYQLKPFSFMLYLKYVNNLNTFVSENDITSENYTLLNLKVNWKATKWLNVFLEGNNLLNTTYEIDRGYPMPAINALGGIEIRYHN